MAALVLGRSRLDRGRHLCRIAYVDLVDACRDAMTAYDFGSFLSDVLLCAITHCDIDGTAGTTAGGPGRGDGVATGRPSAEDACYRRLPLFAGASLVLKRRLPFTITKRDRTANRPVFLCVPNQ